MWIKICGLTQPDVARAIFDSDAGPHISAIGLNFYEKSKRYVTPQVAAEIVKVLPRHVTPVGLFVNHTIDQIEQITSVADLETIQLHGDETPEFCAELDHFDLIRAFRVSAETFPAFQHELERYRSLGVDLSKCLIDSLVSGAFGGTGHTAPWETLASGWKSYWPPLVLAGGLTPLNVAEAIAVVHPAGVDVASGVEATPGVQAIAKVREFVSNSLTIH